MSYIRIAFILFVIGLIGDLFLPKPPRPRF